MLNVIMDARQMEQFEKVYGVIQNTQGEATNFPMERFAEKHSIFKQSEDEERLYVFELVATVSSSEEEKHHVNFWTETNFRFTWKQRDELETLLKKEILSVLGIKTDISSFSEEEINKYLHDHFELSVDSEVSRTLYPRYQKKERAVDYEFGEPHYTNNIVATISVSIKPTNKTVMFMTDGMDDVIGMMIDLLCNEGLPTDPDNLYTSLSLFADSHDLYYVL